METSIQPGVDRRTIRAISEYQTVIEIARGMFEVVSQSGRTYTVDLAGPACTCEDFQYRGEDLGKQGCKHIRAVRLTVGQVDVARLEEQLEAEAAKLEAEADKLAKKATQLEANAAELRRSITQLPSVVD